MSRSKANRSIIVVLLFAPLAGTAAVAQSASCVVLPYGTELSEADLLEVTAAVGCLWLVAGILWVRARVWPPTSLSASRWTTEFPQERRWRSVRCWVQDWE